MVGGFTSVGAAALSFSGSSVAGFRSRSCASGGDGGGGVVAVVFVLVLPGDFDSCDLLAPCGAASSCSGFERVNVNGREAPSKTLLGVLLRGRGGRARRCRASARRRRRRVRVLGVVRPRDARHRLPVVVHPPSAFPTAKIRACTAIFRLTAISIRRFTAVCSFAAILSFATICSSVGCESTY